MSAWADWKRSLTFHLNQSISGTCYFLDTQFKDITRSTISAHRGSNLLSAGICVILKPLCMYSLWNCLITSSILFIFRFLNILPVADIMCWYMVFRKPRTFMWMRSQHRETFLYLSRTPFGEICYHDRFHMLNIMTECFALQVCHTGSIDVLRHTNIFSQNWEVL